MSIRRLLLPALFICGFNVPCIAELQPAEVAIVAARGNQESEGLARYYARVRGVPPENICIVGVPPGEVCSREKWRSELRPEIQKWLAARDPQQKIRCLVTVWGIPLKIGPTPPDPQSLRYLQFLEAERSSRLGVLAKVLEKFAEISPAEPATTSKPNTPTNSASSSLTTTEPKPTGAAPVPTQGQSAAKPDQPAARIDQPAAEITKWQTRLETALQAAQGRIVKLTHEEERNRANTQLQQLAIATGGLNVLAAALNGGLSPGNSPNTAVRTEFDMVRGRLIGYSEAKALFEQMPAGIERDAVLLALVERAGGLIASVQWIDQQLEIVKRNETGAAFDSELALVMWPNDYLLLRWQPNYLRPNYSNSQLPNLFHTLMVSRIDAPTLRLAKGLIDTAIAVEQKGLRGKVYIDARGLAKPDDANLPPGSYADYDRGLLQLPRTIDSQTDLRVVVENTPQLFKPGECKDAALYCGWYSLAKYVDAFEWVPGAVAYHLASAEATTLRDPGSQVWCKKMLEHGVCATIGPVYEPYLAAFPRPEEFFVLLIRGELTLVECYTLTCPFNSWMMTLIGDPLYRPFKYRAASTPAAEPVNAGGAASPGAPPLPAAPGKS